MTKAEELLNTLSDDSAMTLTTEPSIEPHIVIGSDRRIAVPNQLKRIAVQYDHNIETVTFDCPRYWDNYDMSTMTIYINYKRPDSIFGSYIADNIRIDESDDTIMHFDWTISKNVTEKAGTISFLVCIKTVNGEGKDVNHWNSELNSEMYVSQGLEVRNEKAEELLNTLSDDSAMTLTTESSIEPHIVIGSDRRIAVPNQLKRIAVQYDHNVETVTFDCPRYWDNHDMSTMTIYINYKRPDSKLGSYIADNIRIDESDDAIMHFDWTISKNVTEKAGTISFLVCIKTVNDEGEDVNHWNSELNSEMYVSQGLEVRNE